jgi:hypothetical protein
VSDEPGLFDPSPYTRPGARSERRRLPAPPSRTLLADGTWVAMLRPNGPPRELAHRVRARATKPLEGTVTLTVCGLRGRSIAIDSGVTINACATCLASTSAVQSTLRTSRR